MKTWTPESKQWVEPGETASNRIKIQHSAGNVMASVFWDPSDILFIDYLKKRKKINSDYYCALLDQLIKEIARKRPQLF